MAAPRQPLNKATLSVGFHAKLATIRSITDDGLYALAVDRQNIETRVPLLVQRSKGPLPEVGETWLIDQAMGTWTFAAFIAKSPSDFAGGSTAEGNVPSIIVSSAPPQDPATGSLWMASAEGNELFRWSGSSWISTQFGTDALADGAVTAAKIADGTITSQQIAPTAGITAQQVAFTAAEIGGTLVATGTSQPAAPQIGEVWFNPAQDNVMNVWDGNEWLAYRYGANAIQPGSLTSAQISAVAGISSGQVDFTASEIGGITVSISAAQPANPTVGDLWYDATQAYALKQWNGSAWVLYQFGTQAIAAGSITAALIAAGTITATQIAAGTITATLLAAGIVVAGIVDATTINAATFTGSTFNGTNFVINSSGAFFYSGTPAAGNLIHSIANSAGTDAQGNAYLAGTVTYALHLGTFNAISLDGGLMTFWRAATEAGPWTSQGTIAVQVGGMVMTGALTSTAGTVTNPTLITTDNWNDFGAFSTGWSRGTNGYAKYTLLPDGWVGCAFNNIATAGTQVADGYAILAAAQGLPATYRPVTAKRVNIYADRIKTLGATSYEAPALVFNTDGSVAIEGIDSTATRIDGNFAFPVSF